MMLEQWVYALNSLILLSSNMIYSSDKTNVWMSTRESSWK